jgi:hypothetical protein
MLPLDDTALVAETAQTMAAYLTSPETVARQTAGLPE